MNLLKEMEKYISTKLQEPTDIPEHDKAVLAAHIFIVAATSPKDYKECVDRFLARMPAGTDFTHDLQEIHKSTCEWIKPRAMPFVPKQRSKSVVMYISLADVTAKREEPGRFSYFVDLMEKRGMIYPTKEQVKNFAQQWVYDRIDEAIEKDEK